MRSKRGSVAAIDSLPRINDALLEFEAHTRKSSQLVTFGGGHGNVVTHAGSTTQSTQTLMERFQCRYIFRLSRSLYRSLEIRHQRRLIRSPRL